MTLALKMQVSLSEQDYTSRRGELSAYGRAVNSSNHLKFLIFCVALLSIVLVLIAVFLTESKAIRSVLFLICIVWLVGLFLLWKYTKAHFIDPDLAFRKWIQQVCDGELGAGIDLPESHLHYKELDFHTRNLTSSLRRLSTDMESLVESQTKRLESQNRVLELLFQLTSDVACELDIQSVLNTVCGHLSKWLDSADVGAYMLKDTDLKLRAASGPNVGFFKTMRPATDLPTYNSDEALLTKLEFKVTDNALANNKKSLQIPIFKGTETVGMVEIVASVDGSDFNESSRAFQTVSEQLTAFVLRESALEAAHNARLIKARTQLGADLHDSLSQTLLATGYKIRMLRDTVKTSPEPIAQDVERIEQMVSEANAEVRGLIGEFRKPLSEHRPAEAIRKLIDDFNRTSEIEVFFQLDNPRIVFTAREDAMIQRIVGEALNNARKYSRATMIRVYVHMEPSGARSVLIEDDGAGFYIEENIQTTVNDSADHIGLSIMRDRAVSIGAILTIESEIDEGTRVMLKLRPLPLSKAG